MIQELKLKIKECIENYVSSTYGKEVTAVVEQPKNMEMGDLAVPVFVVMKTIGKPLPQVVTEIKELLLSNFSTIKEINPTGGFLNVRVEKEEMCSNILKEVVTNLDNYASNNSGNNNTVVIDYSSPIIVERRCPIEKLFAMLGEE